MAYHQVIGSQRYVFQDLKDLMAKASPIRSGDMLAGIAASCAEENVAAKLCLADLPLNTFLTHALVPYEDDEVTRLIIDTHDVAAFAPIAHLTVGSLRDFLLSANAEGDVLARIAPAITPEMAAITPARSSPTTRDTSEGNTPLRQKMAPA